MKWMKAWHVQEKDGENQEVVFAETRSEAIKKSEALGWVDYIDVRAKRAPYADGLEKDHVQVRVAQLENGWWFECSGDGCHRQVTSDEKYSIASDSVYCEACTQKDTEMTTAQRLVEHLNENGKDYFDQIKNKGN